jgi:bile acid:Na+ symporter, BASS family
MSVLMPLFVAILVWIFDLNPAVKMALVALSVAPLPTLLPMQAAKTEGSFAYEIGVLIVGSVLTIVFVPLAMEIISRVYSVRLHVTVTSIAAFVFMVVLLPLGLGVGSAQVCACPFSTPGRTHFTDRGCWSVGVPWLPDGLGCARNVDVGR